MGSVGQTAYAAAKAGIAAMTIVEAVELGRYGVTANAIAPSARTRMTEGVFVDMMKEVEPGQFDAMDPDNISPLVVWLGSAESTDVTGRVFEIEGGVAQRLRRLAARHADHEGPAVGARARSGPRYAR